MSCLQDMSCNYLHHFIGMKVNVLGNDFTWEIFFYEHIYINKFFLMFVYMEDKKKQQIISFIIICYSSYINIFIFGKHL